MPDATHAGSHATRRTGYLSACEHVPVKALVCLCHSSRFASVAAFLTNLIKDLQTIAYPNGWFQHQCPCSIVATDLRTKRALVTSSTLDSVHLDQFSHAWFVPALCSTRLFMQEDFATLKLPSVEFPCKTVGDSKPHPGQQHAKHPLALTHKVANQ